MSKEKRLEPSTKMMRNTKSSCANCLNTKRGQSTRVWFQLEIGLGSSRPELLVSTLVSLARNHQLLLPACEDRLQELNLMLNSEFNPRQPKQG